MEDDDNKANTSFICTLCDKYFKRNFTLKRHLKVIHKQCFVKERGIFKEFNSFSDFKNWKEIEEKATMSNYVRQRGNATRKNGDVVMNYHCCRSGVYIPKGNGLKKLKSQGTAKIGTTCPARMKVKLTNGRVAVHYFPIHGNHKMLLEHLRLSRADRAAITGKKRNDQIVNQKDITRETMELLPTPCETDAVNSSMKTKLENILALVDKCRFTTQVSDTIHKNLNNILNACNESIQKAERATHVKEIPRKQIKKQRGSFSTKTKKSNRTRLKNSTTLESENIKKGLLSNSQLLCIHVDFDHSYSSCR